MGIFLNQFKQTIATATLGMICAGSGIGSEEIQILSLDVLSYQDFVEETPQAIEVLKKALFEKGIVGIKGVPEYKEKTLKFIQASRKFSALPEEVKEAYAPDRSRGDLFLGYEKGKEKFKRPDGRWVVDDLKMSYYAFVPDCSTNKWPKEVNLKAPFEELGTLMSEMGQAVMKKIGLVGPDTGIYVDGIPRVGRMLYYRKGEMSAAENPYWCGAHFDHGLFTVLLPAYYFVDGQPVPEPMEAGLFVKTTSDGVFKKVVADDPDIMMFQVGEFGQLATNDAIKATEHRVHKASGSIERFTMALFYDAQMDAVIHSTSELTSDARYGAKAGEPCSYQHWQEESFKRYIVQEDAPSGK